MIRRLITLFVFGMLVCVFATASFASASGDIQVGPEGPNALCPYANGVPRCRAMVINNSASYSGVSGTIETAEPVLRESSASSAVQIVVTGPLSQWIELGWTKQASHYNCDVFFYFATQEGNGSPMFLGYPANNGGNRRYRMTIALVDEYWGWWRVKIVDDSTNQLVANWEPITTPSRWNRSGMLQANGEVGRQNINDLGVSGMLDLKYRINPGSGWPLWDWAGLPDVDVPYLRVAIDAPESWQVSGNQGQPGLYCQ